MATTIYGHELLLEPREFNLRLSSVYGTVVVFRNPYPPLQFAKRTYLNKTWDSVANSWVTWETKYPDPNGGFYPGPGTFGVDTSDSRLETVVHSRQQL